MLRTINIEEDLNYIDKYGIPYLLAGIQFAPTEKPIDFQYAATEAITKFEAVKIDLQGNVIDRTTLSTSLVVLSSGRHICNGQTALGLNLSESLYYYNINDKYHTEPFLVTTEMLPNLLELEDGTYLELEDGTYLEMA